MKSKQPCENMAVFYLIGTAITTPGYYGVSALNKRLDTAPTTDPKGYVHWDNTVNEPVLTLYGAEITGGISSGSQPGYEIHIANGTTNSITNENGDAISAPNTSVTIKGNGTLNVTGASNGISATYTVSITDSATVNIAGRDAMGIVIGNFTGTDCVNIGSKCTVTGKTYGIGKNSYYCDVPIISSANVTVIGETAAFHDDLIPVLGGDGAIGAKASTDTNGTNPENYSSNKNSSYKWFKSYALPSYNVKYLPSTTGMGTESLTVNMRETT